MRPDDLLRSPTFPALKQSNSHGRSPSQPTAQVLTAGSVESEMHCALDARQRHCCACPPTLRQRALPPTVQAGSCGDSGGSAKHVLRIWWCVKPCLQHWSAATTEQTLAFLKTNRQTRPRLAHIAEGTHRAFVDHGVS